MVEIREAPVPVKWAWLADGEAFSGNYVQGRPSMWWMDLTRDQWESLPWPRLRVLLSNNQVVIVRAKK